jgi:hypothetical protein
MNETETKRFATGVEFKEAPGSLEARFATFGKIDADGDVTLPGAFKDGGEVVIGSWGHKTAELPIGKGVIRTTPADARVLGKVFINTGQGQDAYQTLKELGPLAQWSYVYRVLKQSFGQFEGQSVRFLESIDVWSVDPVLKGAGVDTGTVALKRADTGLSSAARAEMEGIRVANDVRLAVRAAKATIATLPQPVDHHEVTEWWVAAAVRDAAKAGVERSAMRLGIPAAPVKWFTEPVHVEPKRHGFTSKSSPVVWLNSDLDPETAFRVACHEMRHRVQDASMAHHAAEADANAFARDMLQRAAG